MCIRIGSYSSSIREPFHSSKQQLLASHEQRYIFNRVVDGNASMSFTFGDASMFARTFLVSAINSTEIQHALRLFRAVQLCLIVTKEQSYSSLAYSILLPAALPISRPLRVIPPPLLRSSRQQHVAPIFTARHNL